MPTAAEVIMAALPIQVGAIRRRSAAQLEALKGTGESIAGFINAAIKRRAEIQEETNLERDRSELTQTAKTLTNAGYSQTDLLTTLNSIPMTSKGGNKMRQEFLTALMSTEDRKTRSAERKEDIEHRDARERAADERADRELSLRESEAADRKAAREREDAERAARAETRKLQDTLLKTQGELANVNLTEVKRTTALRTLNENANLLAGTMGQKFFSEMAGREWTDGRDLTSTILLNTPPGRLVDSIIKTYGEPTLSDQPDVMAALRTHLGNIIDGRVADEREILKMRKDLAAAVAAETKNLAAMVEFDADTTAVSMFPGLVQAATEASAESGFPPTSESLSADASTYVAKAIQEQQAALETTKDPEERAQIQHQIRVFARASQMLSDMANRFPKYEDLERVMNTRTKLVQAQIQMQQTILEQAQSLYEASPNYDEDLPWETLASSLVMTEDEDADVRGEAEAHTRLYQKYFLAAKTMLTGSFGGVSPTGE